MRRIIHLSDLHFGADEPAIAEGLLRDVLRQSAHLLVVSADEDWRNQVVQGLNAAAARLPNPFGLIAVGCPGDADSAAEAVRATHPTQADLQAVLIDHGPRAPGARGGQAVEAAQRSIALDLLKPPASGGISDGQSLDAAARLANVSPLLRADLYHAAFLLAQLDGRLSATEKTFLQRLLVTLRLPEAPPDLDTSA